MKSYAQEEKRDDKPEADALKTAVQLLGGVMERRCAGHGHTGNERTHDEVDPKQFSGQNDRQHHHQKEGDFDLIARRQEPFDPAPEMRHRPQDKDDEKNNQHNKGRGEPSAQP